MGLRAARAFNPANVGITGGTISGVTGVPVIVASGRATAQTAAAANIINYTVGASDTSFLVASSLLITASTTFSIFVNVTYTDEGNTSRTMNMSLNQLGGTETSNAGNVAGAVPYSGGPVYIRAKAGTAITVQTSGTFTSVTYNVEARLVQMT